MVQLSLLMVVAIKDPETNMTVTTVDLVAFSRDSMPNILTQLRELRDADMIYGRIASLTCSAQGCYVVGVA